MHPFFLFNGRRRGGSAARCDALLKTFPRDAAASFSAQVLHSRPRRYAEFHDGDRLKSFQESPRKVGLVPREGTPRERVRKLGHARESYGCALCQMISCCTGRDLLSIVLYFTG